MEVGYNSACAGAAAGWRVLAAGSVLLLARRETAWLRQPRREMRAPAAAALMFVIRLCVGFLGIGLL